MHVCMCVYIYIYIYIYVLDSQPGLRCPAGASGRLPERPCGPAERPLVVKV